MFTPMTKVIPPSKAGVAEVQHIDLTESMIGLDNMRAARDGRWFDMVQPGKYAKLIVRGALVMSDTQMEQRTNREFILYASGDVLVGGLGLGMVLLPLFAKKNVKSVTVVEKEPDVIALTAKHVQHKKLTVVNADVFAYEPTRKFDTIYLDIWSERCTDQLEEMGKLTRRYRKWLNKPGWIGCWFQNELRSLKRRGW